MSTRPTSEYHAALSWIRKHWLPLDQAKQITDYAPMFGNPDYDAAYSCLVTTRIVDGLTLYKTADLLRFADKTRKQWLAEMVIKTRSKESQSRKNAKRRNK